MKLSSVAVAAVLVVATPAAAQAPATASAFMTGNRLYEYCKDENANCVGYVAGVADILSAQNGEGIHDGACAPDGMTIEQVIRAFQNYARDHPASLSFIGANVVLLGLREAFPCR